MASGTGYQQIKKETFKVCIKVLIFFFLNIAAISNSLIEFKNHLFKPNRTLKPIKG